MGACNNCGTSLQERAKFCWECGAKTSSREAPADPLVGKQLGAYRVISCISEGGMGRVYRAEQLSLGRMVCIKALLPSLLNERSMVQRFEQEARATSKLRHPNIVDVVDFGNSGDQLYIVMELVEGEDLEQVLKKAGALPWQRAVELTRQILSALGEAHGGGVVHRDLKPANVLISKLRDGSDLAKVTDFGIAKLLDHDGARITETGAMFGTPNYMAPEQIRRGPIDARTDIYATGIMLFELLTGGDMFPAKEPVQAFRAHLHKPPRSPSTVAPHPLPPQLDTIVLKAVAKSPDDRFDSALAFQRALESLRHSNPDLTSASADAGRGTLRRQQSSSGWAGMTAQVASHVADMQSWLVGEKRHVTVLFADISDFTSMAEGMPPEELRTVVNECFEGMVEAVVRYDGTVDKFMGDCVMAVFGAPRAHENDPERAVRCALDILVYLKTLNRTRQQPIGVRIGINTGEVVAGGVGGSRRMDYTVIGDVVNMAQRLQSKARVGGILVSDALKRATGATVVYQKVPPLRIKGKTKAVIAYQVVALAEHSATNTTPLVGRRKPSAKLKQVLLHASRKRVAGAMLVGAAGIGKTQLLEAAANWARGASLAVARARAGRLGRREHLDVVRQLLVSLANGAHTLQALAQDGVSPTSIVTLRHFVAGTSQSAHHSPEDVQRINQAAIMEAFRAVWSTRGLCIVVDDAHLLDSGSRMILSTVLMDGSNRRLALLAAARPGDSAGLLPRLPRIELPGMSNPELLQVARNALDIDVLPAAAQDVLIERAEGNPLVAIELLRTLLERGDITLSNGQWTLQRPIDSQMIPSRLASLVTARVDALTPSSRTLLRMAAVAGRSFALEHVAAAVGGDFDLTAAVDECNRRGFLERDPESARYHFPQQLVHDALLASLTDIDKRQLHLCLAQALDRTDDAPTAVSFKTLAHHYLQAGNTQRANRYLLASANALLRQHAFEDAATQLDTALTLVLKDLQQNGKPSQRVAIFIYDVASKLIAARALTSPAQAVKVAERVLLLLPTHIASTERASVLHEHGAALNKVGEHHQAEQHLRAAAKLLFGSALPERLARVHGELAAALEAQGRFPDAADTLIAGFKLVAGGQPDDPDLLWEYLNQLGRLHVRLHQSERAQRFFENALEHATRAKNDGGRARILSNLGTLRATGGDPASARQLMEQALQLATDCGDLMGQARYHYNLGQLHLGNGEHAAATSHLQHAAAQSQRLGWREGHATALQALQRARAG